MGQIIYREYIVFRGSNISCSVAITARGTHCGSILSPFRVRKTLKVDRRASVTRLRPLIHSQELSYDRGTKHTVAMGADILRLHGLSVLCLMRIAKARFQSDNTLSDGDVKTGLTLTTVFDSGS